jgi:hypothetical protein
LQALAVECDVESHVIFNNRFVRKEMLSNDSERHAMQKQWAACQHAIFSLPNSLEGYTTDDNGRGLRNNAGSSIWLGLREVLPIRTQGFVISFVTRRSSLPEMPGDHGIQ